MIHYFIINLFSDCFFFCDLDTFILHNRRTRCGVTATYKAEENFVKGKQNISAISYTNL